VHATLSYYRRSRRVSERNDRLQANPCSNFKSESEKQQYNAAKKPRSASSNTNAAAVWSKTRARQKR
jgi:hypothetical protein